MSKKKISLFFLLLLVLASSVYASILYTLTVTQTMKLKSSYSLELRRADGTTVIASYSWGDFEEAEGKQMFNEIVKLYNVGNKAVTINITTSPLAGSLGWQLVIGNEDNTKNYLTDSTTTYLFTTFTIGVGSYEGLKILLKEQTASAGVSSSIGLRFNVVE